MRIHVGQPSVALLTCALVATLAACGSPTAGPAWSGVGIHVVDGTWVLAEEPCDPTADDVCGRMARAAEAELGIDPGAVARVATAGIPVLRAVGADGHVTAWLHNTTGIEAFVILDLSDGNRRVAGVACLGVPNADGTRTCMRTPIDDYRVGASPHA